MSVQVSNATEISGLAAATAAELAQAGFGIYSVGNTTDRGTDTAATTIRYSSGSRDEAGVLAAAVPGAELEETAGLGGIVELVLGTDFAGTVTASPGDRFPADPDPQGEGLPTDLTVTNAAGDTCA
ncbi:LytR C-terminal domain-containing protein [Rhodococcus rhodochrous]|uniref:LytR C-terminal domain-containing protein n=1 Tax=Rhodococcus rhodochrous TaxID=1829 RepID=A0AAW4XN74_RHORH|nr:LytR C-terminal domain-containing protein [Rhodococcus rhodochrous]